MAENETAAAAPKRSRSRAGDKIGEGGDNAKAGAGDDSGGQQVDPGDGVGKTAIEAQVGGGESELTGDDEQRPFVAAALVKHDELVDQLHIEPDSGMVFVIRDFMLDLYKTRPELWHKMKEGEQHDLAASLEQVSKELVRQVVEAIASDGRTSIRALLESYAEKDGIKVTLKVKTLNEDEALAAVIGLHRAQGKHVMITVASADDYAADRHDPETLPDAPGLNFEAGSDHPADDSDLAGDDYRRVNAKTGYIERREEEGGEWIEAEPAKLDELQATGGTFRLNLTSGMIENLPEGADAEDERAWVDVRAANPDELAAERERIADFDPEE